MAKDKKTKLTDKQMIISYANKKEWDEKGIKIELSNMPTMQEIKKVSKDFMQLNYL